MRPFEVDQLASLLAVHEPPCVSLYLPTHRRHPDKQQDPIRYRNLLSELETSLSDRYPTREVAAMVEKFQSFSRDSLFWNYRTDALAIFGSPTRFDLYELQRAVPEMLVIADSFHIKPLIRIVQSADRYQILCLNRREARLFEGNRDALDQVELTEFPSTMAAALGGESADAQHMIGSYGVKGGGGGTAVHHSHGSKGDEIESDMMRFFRVVDRGIWEHHSRPSGLPLLLAALPEYHGSYRSITHNPKLMPEGIALDPDALTTEALREHAWRTMEPLYLARLQKLTDDFHLARSRHTASADLSDVARAAVAGRVATLLVEANRVLPGTIDRGSGAIHSAQVAPPHGDDMLDDLAELVIAKGGETIVVPTERMPTESGLAAIYRF